MNDNSITPGVPEAPGTPGTPGDGTGKPPGNSNNKGKSHPFSVTSVVLGSIALAFVCVGLLFSFVFPFLLPYMEDWNWKENGINDFEYGENWRGREDWRDGETWRGGICDFGNGGIMEFSYGRMMGGGNRASLILSIVGLVFGVLGLNKEGEKHRTLPTVGIVLSATALFFAGFF